MTARRRGSGRDRAHALPRRPRAVLLRYSDEEYAAVAEAAQSAGLTPTGFAAEAALAAARGLDAPPTAPLREALLELMAARGQVRRFGVNVNQAVRELNATGEVPSWLAQAVSLTSRAVSELEQAASTVALTSRGHWSPRSTRRPPPPDGRGTASPTAGAATHEQEARMTLSPLTPTPGDGAAT